jgi:ferritin-like metal-binding protein YciE
LLSDQLRDILHAEKQVLKALPKMINAARSVQLQALMETHLQETEVQVERLTEPQNPRRPSPGEALQRHGGARGGR